MGKNTSLQEDNFNKNYTYYYVIACKWGIRGTSEWNNLCICWAGTIKDGNIFFPFLPAFYLNVFQEVKMSFVRRLGWLFLYLSGASDSFALYPKVTACTIKSNIMGQNALSVWFKSRLNQTSAWCRAFLGLLPMWSSDVL